MPSSTKGELSVSEPKEIGDSLLQVEIRLDRKYGRRVQRHVLGVLRTHQDVDALEYHSDQYMITCDLKQSVDPEKISNALKMLTRYAVQNPPRRNRRHKKPSSPECTARRQHYKRERRAGRDEIWAAALSR